MNQIRILHLVDSLNRGSGVMSFIMNMYKTIDRDKVQFDFLVALKDEKESFESDILELGGNIYRIPVPKIREWNNFNKNINVFFTENSNKYQVIHSHVPTLNIFYLNIAKKHGIKFRITHSHSSKSSNSRLKRIRNFFMLLPTKRLSNLYLACSKEAAVYLYGKKSVIKNEVLIIKNGINSDNFKYSRLIRDEYRKQLELEGKFVIGHVGRFNGEKNHEFIIKVFYEVLKQKSDSILVLVGDGQLKSTIEKKSRDLGIEENIRFLGIRKDINNIMQAMDVFILPSFFEGLGIVAIEAQASGLRCFVSNRIPKDVDLKNKLIEFIDLDESAKFWSNKIINYNMDSNREIAYLSVKEGGYESGKVVKLLEDFYINLY